jgi:hypothetical protein
MTSKTENYCKGCKFYIDTVGINVKGFCEVGYTQNPVSKEATQNALRNKAIVCGRNKFASLGFKERKWSMAELLLSHPDSLNKSMLDFPNIDVNLSLYLN